MVTLRLLLGDLVRHRSVHCQWQSGRGAVPQTADLIAIPFRIQPPPVLSTARLFQESAGENYETKENLAKTVTRPESQDDTYR